MTDTIAPELTATEVALKDLAVHELNARGRGDGAAGSTAHAAEDVAELAASILELGLLNPLIVQRAGKAWGVLAGGRRLAAMQRLAGDRVARGWTMRTKVSCRALGDDVAAATAVTLAENVTQRAMDPIDEYEAFARMMEVGGHDPDAIARLFGVERRRVVERLRYGRVHPDIRAAARAKEISLDVMKAFAEHPDPEAQREAFEGVRGSYVNAWTLRDRLRARGTRVGDALGQLVVEEYRAQGGAIVADLIEEDSILADDALVERILMGKLAAHAEGERAEQGLAWAEARREVDWPALRPYGRAYPVTVEPDGEDAERCREVADRLQAIEEELDAEHEDDLPDDAEALHAEHERLGEEHDALTTGWSPEDRACAGVLATWDGSGITTVAGLIRPEDREERRGPPGGATAAGGAATGSAGEDGAGPGQDDDAPQDFVLSASLEGDLRTERAAVIGAGLAADPALAHDLLLFKVAAELMAGFGRVSYALRITAQRALRPHGKPDEVDPRPVEALARLREGLDLAWWEDHRSVPKRFEAFRRLELDMKARITAAAMADAVEPADMDHREPLLAHVARQAVPELRAAWRPTGEAFFARLTKGALLGILARDLRQPEEAARLAGERKGAVVEHLERLFAEPFATLTPEQREAVETWCPPGMAIGPAGPFFDRDHDHDAAPEDAAPDDTGEAYGGFDEDEAFEVDPEEAFDAEEACDETATQDATTPEAEPA